MMIFVSASKLFNREKKSFICQYLRCSPMNSTERIANAKNKSKKLLHNLGFLDACNATAWHCCPFVCVWAVSRADFDSTEWSTRDRFNIFVNNTQYMSVRERSRAKCIYFGRLNICESLEHVHVQCPLTMRYAIQQIIIIIFNDMSKSLESSISLSAPAHQ